MKFQEQQKAVLEKLQQSGIVEPCCLKSNCNGWIWSKSGKAIDWEYHGLQICHEATNKTGLSINIDRVDDEWSVMLYDQNDIKREIIEVMNKDLLTAWLEALCRVWWPERFT